MRSNLKFVYFAFVWHGFFLALTMSMIDFNTVLPTLIDTLNDSKIIFGSLYSIMLGGPLIFNMLFSHYLRRFTKKKKFLLIGMYLRGIAFFGMAFVTYFYALESPLFVILSFYFFITLFAVSAGFAGLSYSDIVAKMVTKEERTTLFTVKQFFSSTASFLGGVLVGLVFASDIAFPLNYTYTLSLGFLGLFVASIGFLLLKEPEGVIEEDAMSLSGYIKTVPKLMMEDRTFLKFVVVENMSSFSMMILPFYILYAREILNIPDSYIGVFLILQVSGTILSNIMWGLIGKKKNAKAIVRGCVLLGALNPLFAVLLGMFSPELFGLVFLIIGFNMSGRQVGFEPYLLDIAPPRKRIEYLGIRGSLNLLVVILPLLGGVFISLAGYEATFITVAVIMMGAFFMLKNMKAHMG
ncbi:MAG: MFS transporter [Bacillota bacterium]